MLEITARPGDEARKEKTNNPQPEPGTLLVPQSAVGRGTCSVVGEGSGVRTPGGVAVGGLQYEEYNTSRISVPAVAVTDRPLSD